MRAAALQQHWLSMVWCELLLCTAVTKGLNCLWLLAASGVCMLMTE